MDFLRLGQVHKVLPELHSYTSQRAAADIRTVNELKQLYESKVLLLSTIVVRPSRGSMFSHRTICVTNVWFINRVDN